MTKPKNTIKINTNLININKPIYISCSGGIDSICAAHMINSLYKKIDQNIKINILHVNHNLSKLNDKMAEGVQKFSDNFSIPCHIYKSNEIYVRSKENKGLEAHARSIREKAWMSLPDDSQIILAHHIDDAIESYIMNCLRGVASKLPLNIKTRLTDDGKDKSVTLIRPFLLSTKKSFHRYAKLKRLEKYVVQDISNYDHKICTRNYVRLKLIPMINADIKSVSLHKVITNIYKGSELYV